jgi:hypothetical protein
MITAEKFVESNPNSSSRLVIKRAATSPENLYLHGTPIIDDICLVNVSQEEIEPDGFRTTSKFINPKGSTSYDQILISFHQRDPLGICDIQFESLTIDRYPDQVTLLPLSPILPSHSSYRITSTLTSLLMNYQLLYFLNHFNCIVIHLLKAILCLISLRWSSLTSRDSICITSV